MVTPIARPIVVDSVAMVSHSDSGIPSMMAMTRAAYGSAKSETNSHCPGRGKASMSSLARSANRGASSASSFGEKAGLRSRRSRRWSSPSLSRIQLAHHSASGPSVMPL